MGAKKLNYGEGTVFALPLERGGFGRGVISRLNPECTKICGYFFAPRLASLDDVRLDDLRPEAVNIIQMVGYLGLKTGTWKILGTVPNWDRAQWPIPQFVRIPMPEFRKIVTYDPDNPSRVISSVRSNQTEGLLEDGLHGDVSMERLMDKRLELITPG